MKTEDAIKGLETLARDFSGYKPNEEMFYMAINALKSLDKIKQHLFQISYDLDNQSVREDYGALRKTHYKNIEWMQDQGLGEDYYKYFFKRFNQGRKTDGHL